MSFPDDDFLHYSLNELTKTDSPPPGGNFYDPIDNIPLNEDPNGSPYRDYGDLSYNNDLSVPLGDYQYGNDQMRSSPNGGYHSMHNMQTATNYDSHMQPSTSMSMEYNSFEMPTVITTNGSQMDVDQFVDMTVLDQNNTYYANQQPSTSDHQSDQHIHIIGSDNQYGQQVPQQTQLMQMQPSTSYGQPMDQSMNNIMVDQQHQIQHQQQQSVQQQNPPPKPPPKKSKSSRKKQPPNTVGAVLTKVNKISQQIGDGGGSSIETRMTPEDSARIGQLMNEMARLQNEQQNSGIDNSALLAKLQTEFSSIFAKNLSQSSSVNNTEIMTQIKSLTGEPQPGQQQQQQQPPPQQQQQHIQAPQQPKRPPPKRNRNQQKNVLIDTSQATIMPVTGPRYGAEPDSPGYQPQMVYQSNVSMQQPQQHDTMGNMPSTSGAQPYMDYQQQQQQPIIRQGQQQTHQQQSNIVPSMNSRTHIYRQQAVVYQSTNGQQLDGQSLNSQQDGQYQSQQVYVQQQGQPILISRQHQNEQSQHMIDTPPNSHQQKQIGRDHESMSAHQDMPLAQHGTPQQQQLYDNGSGSVASPSMVMSNTDTPTLRQHLLAGGRLTPNSTANSSSKAIRRVSSANTHHNSLPGTPQTNNATPKSAQGQLHNQMIVVSEENRHLFPNLPIGMVFQLVQNTTDPQIQTKEPPNIQQQQQQQQQKSIEQSRMGELQSRQIYDENIEPHHKVMQQPEESMEQHQQTMMMDDGYRPAQEEETELNMDFENETESAEETAKLLERYEDLRSQRENAMAAFLQQQRDKVEFPDPFTAFKSKQDMLERLLPFHLLSKPEISQDAFDDFDDNWLRHNININQAKKSLENRIKKICLEDSYKHSYASERNMIMYLETEFERKQLKEDMALAADNLEEFVGTSKIVSSFNAGTLATESPLDKPLHISTEWEDGQLSEYYKEYEYHSFSEKTFISSPYESPLLSNRSDYTDISVVSSPMKSPLKSPRRSIRPLEDVKTSSPSLSEKFSADEPQTVSIKTPSSDARPQEGNIFDPIGSSKPAILEPPIVEEPVHIKSPARNSKASISIMPPPLPIKSSILSMEPAVAKNAGHNDLISNIDGNVPFIGGQKPSIEKPSSSTANTFEDSDGSASPELGLDDMDDYYRPPDNNVKKTVEEEVATSEAKKKSNEVKEDEKRKEKEKKKLLKEEKRRSKEEKRKSQENGRVPIISTFKIKTPTPEDSSTKPVLSLRVPISVYKCNSRQEDSNIKREIEDYSIPSHAPIKIRIKLPLPVEAEPKKNETIRPLEIKSEIDDPEFNSIEIGQKSAETTPEAAQTVEPMKAKITKEIKTDSPSKMRTPITKAKKTESPTMKTITKTSEVSSTQSRKRRISEEKTQKSTLLNGQRKAVTDERLARIVVNNGSMKLRLNRLNPSVLNLFAKKTTDSPLSPTESTRLKMTILRSGGACSIKFDESGGRKDSRINGEILTLDTPKRSTHIQPVGVKNRTKAFVRMSDKSKLKVMSAEKKKRKEESSAETSATSSPTRISNSANRTLKAPENRSTSASTKPAKQSTGMKNSKAFCNRFNPFASVPKPAPALNPPVVNSTPSAPTVKKISALSGIIGSSKVKSSTPTFDKSGLRIAIDKTVDAPVKLQSLKPPTDPVANPNLPSPNAKRKISALLPWMTDSEAEKKPSKSNSEVKPPPTKSEKLEMEIDIAMPKTCENVETNLQLGSPRAASSMSLTALFDDEKSNGGFPFLGSPPRTSEPLPAVEFSDDDDDSEMQHTDFSRATERIIAMSSNAPISSNNSLLPWQKDLQ